LRRHGEFKALAGVPLVSFGLSLTTSVAAVGGTEN
jgi:hypothetical protein